MGPKDFNLLVKVRNARLLRAMRAAGVENGAQLARLAGITCTAASQIIAMKSAPIKKKTGDYKDSALKICAALNASPADIWPPHLAEYLPRKNAAEIEVSSEEIVQLLGDVESSETITIRNDALRKMLPALRPRELEVIKRRYGLDRPAETLEEVCEFTCTSRERARQIEAKAIRKMRNRAKTLGLIDG